MLNSFKSKVLFTVTTIVAVSLIVAIVFFGFSVMNEFSDTIEDNALNMIESMKLNIESQYKNIVHHRNNMFERRKVELENNTQIAFSIVESAYQAYQDGSISELEAQEQVIVAMKNLRYDKGVGYFWINDVTRPYPYMIMHPTIPELDGQILDDETFFVVKDTNENLFEVFVDVVLAYGAGYVEYLWPKPTEEGLTEQQPKISYVRLFEPWNWVIGTGLYIDDIEADEENRIQIAIADLNSMISTQKIGENGYYFIFDDANNILVHPSLAGTYGGDILNPETNNVLLEELVEVSFREDNYLEYVWNTPQDPENYIYEKKTYVTYYEPLGWYIASSYYKEDFQSKIREVTFRLIRYSVLFLILAVIASILLIRSLLKPLNALISSIKETERGLLPSELNVKGKTREINLLKDTINKMIESIKESEEELNKAHMKLQSVLDSATLVSIISTTPDGIIEVFSTGAEKMLGYTASKVIEKETPKLFHLESEIVEKSRILSEEYGEDIEGFDVFVKKAREDGYEECEWTYIKKDGGQISVYLGVTTIRDEKGLITGYLCVGMDITQRTIAQGKLKERTIELAEAVSHLKEQEESLEDLVAERTFELEESLRALKEAQDRLIESEKIAALGGLVAGVAHEINTPVGMSITLASNLEDQTLEFRSKLEQGNLVKSDLVSFIGLTEESAQMILHNMNRADELISRFKLAAVNHASETKRLINVLEYMNTIVRSTELKNVHSGIEVDIKCEENLTIYCYPGTIYQIMTNLIENSIKHGFEFKDHGSVSIEIKLEESDVVFIYKDDGIGIKKEDIAKIFEPFYTVKKEGSGTGMGLNIVYNLVRQNLNGTIECESEYGSYTKFVIRLPLDTKDI